MISTKLKKLVDPKNECCCESHLAHKCKEWAYNTTGLAVWSTVLTNGSKSEVFKVVSLESDFYADTEPKSIFKACEWIMEQTK